MLKESYGGTGCPNNLACWHACETCHAVGCTVYCHTDSTYLCNRCEECICGSNPTALHHECVWVCTACENAAAVLTCQADATSFSLKCDAEVHLANFVAHHHNMVPILPLSGVMSASTTAYLGEMKGPMLETEKEIMTNKKNEELEKDETDSWLLLDLDSNDNENNSGFTYSEANVEYWDLPRYNSSTEYQCQDQNDQQKIRSASQEDNVGDGVVPVEFLEANKHQQQQQQNIYFNKEDEASKLAFINGQRVAMPFMNAGYLLRATSDISNSCPRFPRETIDLFPNPALWMPLQFMPTTREARVLRYKEKRKSRKFDKKIRYASRKANAETRPRVKGRFARKGDTGFEEDQMFSSEDYGYEVVPLY